MPNITRRIRIKAPKSEVWQRLNQLDLMADWALQVQTAFYSSDIRDGIGAERTCKVSYNMQFVETVDEWEFEQSLGYNVTGFPLIKYSHMSWHLQEDGNETIVTIKFVFEVNGPILGFLLDRILIWQSNKTLTQEIAEFKYYVENGKGAPNKAVLALAEVV